MIRSFAELEFHWCDNQSINRKVIGGDDATFFDDDFDDGIFDDFVHEGDFCIEVILELPRIP